MKKKQDYKSTKTLGIALIVCKNPETGKYLAVN